MVKGHYLATLISLTIAGLTLTASTAGESATSPYSVDFDLHNMEGFDDGTISAEDIEAYIQENYPDSPLLSEVNIGSCFISAGLKNNVNPAFLVATAELEGRFGTAGWAKSHPSCHNTFGWAITDTGPIEGHCADRWCAMTQTVAYYIAHGAYYYTQHKYTVSQIREGGYATNPNSAAIAGYMNNLYTFSVNRKSNGPNAAVAGTSVGTHNPPNVNPPTINFPGSRSEPGDSVNTLSPQFQWTGVSNADYYSLYISKYPYHEPNIIFDSVKDYGPIYGSSFNLPSGYLQDGMKYRWNMKAHSSSGWSSISNTLYFQISIVDQYAMVNSLTVVSQLGSQTNTQENDAKNYCSKQGGYYQEGACIFPDGTSCNAQDFLSGKCSHQSQPITQPATQTMGENLPIQSADQYAMVNSLTVVSQLGSQTNTQENDAKNYCSDQGGEYHEGACIFPDGYSCNAQELYSIKGTHKLQPETQPVPQQIVEASNGEPANAASTDEQAQVTLCVLNAWGNAIPSVQVSVQDGNGKYIPTNLDGNSYAIIYGVPGNWQITASAPCYVTNTVSHKVSNTDTIDIRVYLQKEENCDYNPSKENAQITESKQLIGPINRTLSAPDPTATYCAYCKNQGYDYQDGACIFPDGSSCDARSFYIGECIYNPQPTPQTEIRQNPAPINISQPTFQPAQQQYPQPISQPALQRATAELTVEKGGVAGPIMIPYAQVTIQDGVGNIIQQSTDINGHATITGVPGTWQYAVYAPGYLTNTGAWQVSNTGTSSLRVFLQMGESSYQPSQQYQQPLPSSYVQPQPQPQSYSEPMPMSNAPTIVQPALQPFAPVPQPQVIHPGNMTAAGNLTSG